MLRPKAIQKNTAGFTLLEVLVAISIFALIGLASYRVLGSVLQTDERLAARNEELRRINRAFWLLQQDIEQLTLRPVRSAGGTESSYLVVNANEPLQFTRAGRANPLGLARSDMQRVAYHVDRHPDYEKSDSPHYHEDRWYLLRYTWPALDGSGDNDKAQKQVLLPDIDKLTVSIFTESGVQTEWPPAAQQPGQQLDPPLALQLELIHHQWGAIKRSFKVL